MRFTFRNDSWWDNACDCCEPTLMECYNYTGDDFVQNGSAHSYWNCCEQVLEHLGIEYGDDDVLDLIRKHNILIIIEDDE